MHKLVEELKGLLTFKDTTDIGDIVLIVAKEPQMLLYALVRDIERDTSRRDEWWQVHLSFLAIPIQQTTWTLRTEQMTGMETFTMGGEERFVKAIDFGSLPPVNKAPAAKDGGGKIHTLKRIK